MAGISTADALLDAAEAAFAVDGFDGASLRAVMRSAGTDPGAVHYHFGGREQLAAGVLNRVLAPLNRRRLELLTEASKQAAPSPPPLAALVAAIVRPDLEAAADLDAKGPGRAQLIGAIYLRPSAFVTAQVEQHFAPVAQVFMPKLMLCLPDVPAEVVAWRVRWVIFAMVGALLADRPESPAQTELTTLGIDVLTDRVVAAGCGALTAPAMDHH